MPYYSELGSYSGSSSLYSPSYISGPYANHSSILASNYIRPPSSYLNTLSRNYRGYKPHLSTISERRTDSPLRRIIPQLVIHSVPKVNIPRPIKINTADIDVSINKYRNYDRPSRNTTNTNKERQTASKSPSPTKTVESPRGSFEIKEATPNKTIKRERATVRLKTIHKDRLPLNELSFRKWRDNFHPNELNPDEVNMELKKPKKSPGELLKEKFLIPHKVDIQEAPVKQRIERKGSVKAKSAVLKSPSFHDICKAITYETIDEELNPGQPVEIQRRQSRQFSTEDILKEVRRNSRELTDKDIGMLNSAIDGKSGSGVGKIHGEVDHDEEPFDSRGSVKKRRRISRTYSDDIMLNDPESCKTTIQRRPAQKKYKRTSTDSSFASDSETEKAYQKAIRDISQVEVEEIKTKPKPIFTTSVDIEEKKVPKLKAVVNEVEVVESPTFKKTNKLIFNFTFEEIKDNQLETIIPETTQDKRTVENQNEKKDKPKSNKSPLKPIQKKELKPGFAIENYGVHQVPKSKDVMVSKMIRNKQQAQIGHILENINETPTEENDGNETCKIGESENFQYKSNCEENSKNKLNVITECDVLKPLEKSKLKLAKVSSDIETFTKSSEEKIKNEKLSSESNKIIPTTTKETIKINVTAKPKLPSEIVKVKSCLTAKQEIKVEAIAKALRASLGRKDVIKDVGPKSTIRVLNREKVPTELTDKKREVNEDQSSTVTEPKTSTQLLSSLDSGIREYVPPCSVEGTNKKQSNSGIGEEPQAKIDISISVSDNKTKTTENKKKLSESKLISELPNDDIKKTTSTMKTSSIKNKNKSDKKIDVNVNTENFWEQIGTRESVHIFKRPILSSKGSILAPEIDKIDKEENTDKAVTTKIDTKDEIIETPQLETNKIEMEVERKKLISKRSLIQKANKIDPDMVVFEPPEPEPEEAVVEEKKDVFIPLQSNRISQFMNPFHKPEQFDVCPVEIFARPKTIRKRHYPRGRHHAAQPPPPPPPVEEDETSEEESDESSSESEATTEGEFEINDSGKVGASTSSNDSGFDSGAAPGSRDKDCDVNCHKKCEKLTANLCGVNQKLIVEAIESLKKGSGSHSESRESPASTPATNPAFALDDEEDYSKSSTYASFQKNGRITPPATTIPRFRKYCVEDFNFLKLLGKGSFGKVLLAELKDTEYYYAVKCLKKDVVLEDDDVECTLIERKVLALGTKHPYLCHLLCTFQTDSHLFFVMEYLNGGDLMFHIQQSGRFPEARARFYGAEIVSGLKFLHNKGIVYRDLKLDNILLDFDGHVRIADFGMCKLQVFLDRMADTFCGTPDYMAPEIIKGQHYNQSVDWWSYGVLLYEMLLGQSPFSGCDEDELFWSICNEKPVLPRFLSTDASNILTLFLEKDANNRLGNRFCPSGDITDQPFFRSINWDQLEARLLEPPFKPTLQHPLDTKYFDTTFTVEKAKLTPIEQNILESMDQTQFQGFSYTNPNATDK